MKKICLFLYSIIVLVFPFTTLYAQETNRKVSTLDNLLFKSYEKFLLPNDRGTEIYLKPDKNTPLNEVWLSCNELTPVIGETTLFWKTPKGYVPKKNSRISSGKPLTSEMMNTNQCGYCDDMDLWETWRVFSPIGSKALALCHRWDGYSDYLLLGKVIDNIMVFKFAVQLEIEIDEKNPDVFTLGWNDEHTFQKLFVGINYCVKLKPGVRNDETGNFLQPYALDLSKFNDKLILYFFEEVIKRGETQEFYINSELLTGDFANFFM